MKELVYTYTLNDISKVARDILQNIGRFKVLTFEGELGAGKTTLIKALAAQLKTVDLVSSPTYTIVNKYLYPKGEIYHIDAYRLKNEEEAFDIGMEEIIYSGGYVWIEWPQIIENILPEDVVSVKIDIENSQRKLTLQIP